MVNRNLESGLGFLTFSAARIEAWSRSMVEMLVIGTPWLMQTL